MVYLIAKWLAHKPLSSLVDINLDKQGGLLGMWVRSDMRGTSETSEPNRLTILAIANEGTDTQIYIDRAQSYLDLPSQRCSIGMHFSLSRFQSLMERI